MNLQSILGGVILVAICFAPLYLFNRNRKKNEKRLLKLLSQFASTNNSKIDEYEFGYEFALGLDRSKTSLFLIRDKENEGFAQLVDLSQFKKCSAEILGKQDGKGGRIDRISLSFTPKNPQTKEQKLELYNSDMYPFPNGEPVMAKKWVEKANALINSR